MQHFAERCAHTDADLAMDARELRGYLRNMDYNAYYPMAGILAQTEAIGDPALPATDQRAILSWLDAAMADWDQSFPLEEPLAAELRRLRPVIAAQALMDASFLTPGAHPLHQLLDAVQSYAVGWQARLGRVGEAMAEEVRAAISACLLWLDSSGSNGSSTRIADSSAKIVASAAKAAARAKKMTQRLVETERGQIKVARSKHTAALMINAALAKYRAPIEIGAFLKGPWYDSAQLLLMKFGGASAQWKHMSLTTTRLLESLQPPDCEEESEVAGRQRAFELVAQLPNELAKWLLSLQHDGEAVDEVLGSVEVLHSQVLRGRSLQLEGITPIALEPQPNRGKPGQYENLSRFKEGQWFILNKEGRPPLRAMLALRLDDEQQLLFTNQAGIKVLKNSFSEFARLVTAGGVVTLDTGASFSRCLARSVGVETQDDLDELTGVAALKARRKAQEQEKIERERLRLELRKAEREELERERLRKEQQEQQRIQREHEEAQRLRREREQAEQLKREQAEQERLQLAHEREETKRLQQKWEDVTGQFVGGSADGREPPVGVDEPVDDSGLNIPRCSWLGFRDGDGEEVVLARLAVYNRQEDQYLFVDRYGMKVRQLNSRELLLILSRGLIDILEARSRFRDEVAQAQKAARHRAQ